MQTDRQRPPQARPGWGRRLCGPWGLRQKRPPKPRAPDSLGGGHRESQETHGIGDSLGLDSAWTQSTGLVPEAASLFPGAEWATLVFCPLSLSLSLLFSVSPFISLSLSLFLFLFLSPSSSLPPSPYLLRASPWWALGGGTVSRLLTLEAWGAEFNPYHPLCHSEALFLSPHHVSLCLHLPKYNTTTYRTPPPPSSSKGTAVLLGVLWPFPAPRGSWVLVAGHP